MWPVQPADFGQFILKRSLSELPIIKRHNTNGCFKVPAKFWQLWLWLQQWQYQPVAVPASGSTSQWLHYLFQRFLTIQYKLPLSKDATQLAVASLCFKVLAKYWQLWQWLRQLQCQPVAALFISKGFNNPI